MDNEIKQKIDSFFEKFPQKNFEKKQILIYGGEEPVGIYHIISGNVRQYDINKKGNELVLNVFKPPAFFPMDWAVTKIPNKYFFEAYTPVEVRLAPVNEVMIFLKSNPDVLFDLLARIYSGLQGVQKRMSLLMGGDVYERALLEISMECRRFGEYQKDGSYLLAMHESELAYRSGLTRETISRQIQILKNKGLIDINHKNIRINNLKKLEEELE